MKITANQLKKIISEEVTKARLAEAPAGGMGADALSFYKIKSHKLQMMHDKIERLVDALDDLKAHEASAPGGDLSELEVLDGPLTALEEEVTSLIDAVDAMIP